MSEPLPDMVAAVDLGSNSFHLLVARVVGGQFNTVDRIKERVALADGLDREGYLSYEAQARALECLDRFGQRLRPLPKGVVRAVGTNTLRKARNARTFLELAHRVLGHPIEVISGREEARLVYLGVVHDLSHTVGRRLVVDIGGGSTECVIGDATKILSADSLYMGCVSYSKRFFADGEITRDRMENAITAARLELQPHKLRYAATEWEVCNGSSGTINAIERIVELNGWSERGVTPKALKKLRKHLLSVRHLANLEMEGLSVDRTPVLAGGVAILSAIFDRFKIEAMQATAGALREGLLVDLLGRFGEKDVRELTVKLFAERWGVDAEQARRVKRTAVQCLDQVAEDWAFTRPKARRFLRWAARLHEVGLSISYTGYHKHGAYLVSNSDMAGFSQEDKVLLAALILGHRRKLSKHRLRSLGLASHHVGGAVRLCLLLRIAIALNRSRNPLPLPNFTLEDSGDQLNLGLPDEWLKEHPLTYRDLIDEAERFKAAGVDLVLSDF